MAICAAFALLDMSWIEFAVVADLAANSPSMLPVYFCASATLSRFSFRPSKFESSGAIAPSDSLPKSSLSAAACFSLLRAWIDESTCKIVPLASLCIFLATTSDSRPRPCSASFCDFVALSPAVSERIKFLMPVAATSDWIPEPTIDAPRAAISPDATPPTSPSGPMRVTTSEMSGALAAVVFPR